MLSIKPFFILAFWTFCVCFHAVAASHAFSDDKKDPTKDPPVTGKKEDKVGDADKAPPKNESDARNERRKVTATILAELAEKHDYRLEPNLALRRIAPPFPEQRDAYYRARIPSRGVNVPQSAAGMTFFWDGKELRNWGMAFGAGYALTGIVDDALKIKSQDIEGPAEFLNKRLEGDWIIRPGASEDQVIQELQTILQKDFQMPVRLAFAKRVRTVYVARGKYQFKAVERKEDQQKANDKTTSHKDRIEIYGNELGPSDIGGGSSGEFKEFLNWVGRWTKTTVIDEVADSPKHELSWHDNESAKIDEEKAIRTDRNPELVLKNISAQTGLTFTKELRPIRRLLVERIE